MAEFKLLPIPAEEYDALGITPHSVVETNITDNGALIIRIINSDDFNDLICNNDCESCPL